MRNHNHLNKQVLKILMFIGLFFMPQAIIFGQEEMQNAIVTVSFSEENETKMIKAKALDEMGLPIEDLELYFFVQRTFSLLPIGDNFNATDENGIIELEFPNDLPGDVNGSLIIVTKLMESDMYNDITLEHPKKWGIPVEIVDEKNEQRSLWAAAANAPISLIFTVSLLILAIWYIICYILYKLYKISRIKPLNN